MPRKPHDSHCSLVNANYSTRDGKIIRIKYKDKLYAEFPDIAMLDLATLSLPAGSIIETLEEYNSGLYKDGTFYNYMGKTIRKTQEQIIIPAFDLGYIDKRKLLDKLREQAEIREYNYNHGESYSKIPKNNKNEDLIFDLLKYLVYFHRNEFLQKSEIARDITNPLQEEEFVDYWAWLSNIAKNDRRVFEILSSYTQFRMLVLAVLKLANGITFDDKDFIKKYGNYTIHKPTNMSQTDYQEPTYSFEQKQLHDFCKEIPYVKSVQLKKKRK